jgi:DNA-binding NarL/FixJ family response regulator
MTIRLAIVDGHTLTRYGLCQLIAQHADIKVVAECGSVAAASETIAASDPDVATIDSSLPDGDGMRLARDFRDRYAGLGIVMLTSRGEDDVLFRAMETGVSAFVAKTAPVEEVLAAIRHAAVAASSFTASGLAVAITRRRMIRDLMALSPRETQVLHYLRDGTSIPAIALAMYISQSTAKTYVARLYDKLGATNRAQALMTAIRYGLINYEGVAAPAGARAEPGGLVTAAAETALSTARGLRWRPFGGHRHEQPYRACVLARCSGAERTAYPAVKTAPIRSIISASNGWGVAKLNRNDPSPPAPNAGPSTTLTCARSVTSTPGDSVRFIAVQSSQAR